MLTAFALALYTNKCIVLSCHFKSQTSPKLEGRLSFNFFGLLMMQLISFEFLRSRTTDEFLTNKPLYPPRSVRGQRLSIQKPSYSTPSMRTRSDSSDKRYICQHPAPQHLVEELPTLHLMPLSFLLTTHVSKLNRMLITSSRSQTTYIFPTRGTRENGCKYNGLGTNRSIRR